MSSKAKILVSSPDWDFTFQLFFAMMIEHGKQREVFENRACWSQ